jgi:hypothetical protein
MIRPRDHQLGFDAVLDQGVTTKIKWWAGYTFGWPRCLRDYERWCCGVVVTPRYATELARAFEKGDPFTPVMLDNGAWPAFRDNRNLYVEDMLDDMHTAIETLGVHRVEWAIVPDDVGNPHTTAARIERSLRRCTRRVKWLIPIQEGMSLRDVGQLGMHFGGVFIGGRTHTWKLATAQALRTLFPDLYIHVGRLSKAGHLHQAAQIGINSFDTTTFMIRMGSNQHTDYRPRLARYTTRFYCREMFDY